MPVEQTTISLKQRDTYRLETALTDPETGDPYDLSDANEVRLYVEHGRSEDLVVDAPVEIINAAAGEVAYDLSRAETARSGTHRAEFEIDESSSGEDDYTTVPDDGYVRIDVTRMLNRNVDAEPVEIRGDWEVTRVTATESVRSPAGQFAEQLGLPVYSSDADAPRETGYFNETDGQLKYKDRGGGVHAGDGGLLAGEDFNGQGESSFTNLESVGVESLNSVKHVTPSEHNSGERTIQDAAEELAAEGISGKVELSPVGDYEVGSTQVLDAQHVRLLDGNGARIKLTADVPALHLQGTWSGSQTSIASTYTRADFQSEAGPAIKNVHVYSDQTPYIGTGIEVDGVFNPRILNCHLYHLKDCLVFAPNGNIRNVSVSGSQIYDSDRGIVFEAGGNMHQALIQGNYIGYHRVHIHFEDCELDEPIIQGNDIESGTNNAGTDPENYILAEPNNHFNRKLKVQNNHFETHGDIVDYGIKLVGDGDVPGWQITDNFLAPASGGIQVDQTSTLHRWIVSNNLFGDNSDIDINAPVRLWRFTDNIHLGGGMTIEGDQVYDSVFSGNTFVDGLSISVRTLNKSAITSNTFLSSLDISQLSGESGRVFNAVVSMNTFRNSHLHITGFQNGFQDLSVMGNSFDLAGFDVNNLPALHVQTADSMEYSNVSHNVVMGKALDTVPTGGSDEYVAVVDAGNSLWSVGVESNSVRGFNDNANGLQVTAGTPQAGIIKNNMVARTNNTGLDLVADADWSNAGVTKDNLST